jgi:PAS domain S-box-containing protein
MDKEGMFRELVENSNDIIIVTDEEFKIRYISSAVTKIFDIEPIKVLGLSIFTFVSPEKIDNWRACLLDPAYSSFQEEISLKNLKDQKFYFDIQVSNLLNKTDIQGLFIRLHDITAKKDREKELIRSNQQLDQVIYKTTHDLKAPLLSAMGLVNLAEKASAEERDKYLDLIKKSLLRLDSLIDEMNDFFRNEKLALKRDKINVAHIIKDELGYLRNLYEAYKIDIQFIVEGDTDFYSDSIRLKTVITNLLSNAIKYTDPKKSEPFIKISVYIKEEFCELRFADNGIGIEPKYHEKIFELFFRATTHSQGTGLGLFIVKDTIEKLKGTIEVDSKPGLGTVFTIQVPNQIFQPVEVG